MQACDDQAGHALPSACAILSSISISISSSRPHLPESGAQAHKVRVEFFVKGLQRLGVLGVGDEPVDRGEVLALREFLVEAPEHLWPSSWARFLSMPVKKVAMNEGKRATTSPLSCL